VTRDLRRERQIAVLGAGMLGSSLAILLARRGVRVTLFEASERPMNRAGRWNEGKIHLGYLYAADRSLNTARKLIPGGVAFQPIVENMIGSSIEPHLTRGDEIFLTHAKSVVDPDSMFRHLNAVWELVSDMRGDKNRPTSLTRDELAEVSENRDIVAGFRVPERSVNTNWLADRIVDRVVSDRHIELRCNCSVTSLSKGQTHWRVITDCGAFDGFDAVVNALWEGKSVIDEEVGRSSNQLLSYRYRVAAFMKVPNVGIKNVVITTGPFGDMKNYDGQHIYLSWYPVGLLLDCHQKHAPASPKLDRAMEREICGRMVDKLSDYFPAVINLPTVAEQLVVRGGWIVAHGEGLLSDPMSTLHRRDEFGILRYDNYYSVETGKYSVAPWLASQIANELVG
jgi:glycine/D-amino acid oxidase-like deaminating enzyme